MVKEKTKKKKKLGPGVCNFCGKKQPLCYICPNCGFTICQRCFIEHQKLFTQNGITWLCINCSSWHTL